jgi:hypothetical protein
MKKTILVVVVVVVILFCICAIAAGFWYFSKNYSISKAPAGEPTQTANPPPLITILSPNFGTSWQVSDSVPLRAYATSDYRIRAMEVWVDGKIFDSRDDLATHDLNYVNGWFEWQPGTTGLHSILFRAVDENGQTGYSKVVQVNATPPEATVELVEAAAGQTLDQIAEAHQVDADTVHNMNSNNDPAEPLDAGEPVFIPHGAVPVVPVDLSNVHYYEPPVQPAPTSDWVQNLVDQFSLITGTTPPETAGGGNLPAAPTLVKAGFSANCGAVIEFKDNATNEDGYIIYRSSPHNSELLPIVQTNSLASVNLVHSEASMNSKGAWTFVAAAFNKWGESKGTPVTLVVNDPKCIKDDFGSGWSSQPFPTTDMEDWGVVITSDKIDLAYVYVTVNEYTIRIPPGDFTFLEGSGYRFDLSKFMLDFVWMLPPTKTGYNVSGELWGWKDNKAFLASTFKTTISEFTELYGCLVTEVDACDKDTSIWQQYIMVSPDADLTKLKFRFKLISFNPVEGYVIKKYLDEFPGSIGEDFYTVFSKQTYSMKNSINPAFQPIYFDESLEPYFNHDQYAGKFTKQETACNEYGDDCESARLGYEHSSNEPLNIYYEVSSWPDNGSKFNPLSNRVYIRQNYWENLPEFTTQYSTFLPDIYSVEFLEETYKPAVPADPSLWGCIKYLENADGYQAGQIRCPEQIQPEPCDDSMSLKCVAALYDYIVGQFNEAVSGVANLFAKAIPGCEKSPKCIKYLSMGFKMAFTYFTGIPPNLPNSNQLMDEGINYAADVFFDSYVPGVVDALGGEDLPDWATQLIDAGKGEAKDKLKEYLKTEWLNSMRGVSGHATASCLYPNLAKSKGKAPLCPSGAWMPYPGSEISPPSIEVKITRKPFDQNSNPETDAGSITQADIYKYGLKVTSNTVNSNRVGEYIPQYNSYNETYKPEDCPCKTYVDNMDGYACRKESIWIPCDYEVVGDMVGKPYKDIELPVPWLEPGQSVTFPLNLQLNTYYFGGHNSHLYAPPYEDPREYNKLVGGDDWLYLYFKGQTTLKADEVCAFPKAGKLPCGSGDEFSPAIPYP